MTDLGQWLTQVGEKLAGLLAVELWRGITLFDIILSIVILLVGLVIVRYVSRGLGKVLEKMGLPPLVRSFLVRVFRFLVFIAILGLALSPVGVDLTSLAVGFGVLGIVVGLALQSVLSNMAAGILLLVLRPFKKGHVVEVAGITGIVEDLTIHATTLKTFDGRMVMIPSQKVWGSPIVNYHAWPIRRIDLVVGISYEDDVDKALNIVRRILEGDERILKEPGPATNVRELAESSVNLNVFAWVKQENFGAVKNDLMRKIKGAFEREGITIPYPTRTLYVKEGVQG